MPAIALFEQPSSDPVTIGMLFRAYKKFLETKKIARELSANYVSGVYSDLDSFAKLFGEDRLVTDCHQFDLTEWLRANPSWKSNHTKKRAINAVIGCFRWGADDEEGSMIDRCPYRYPKLLKGKTAEPRRPATEEEYLTLLRNGSKPLKRALFFLWHTGARTCEMRELQWTDVFFGQHPHIRLEQHKTRNKTGKARIIALSPVVAAFLTTIKKTAKGRWVFTNCDGGKWDRHVFARHLRRTAKRIGLDDGMIARVSGYCLRHSYACAAVENGSTYEQVADALGNSPEIVRKVYASHTRSHLDYMSRIAGEIGEVR